MIKFEVVKYVFLVEEAFIVFNRLLWTKAKNILHWFCIEPIRKYQVKDIDFDLIKVNFSTREPEVLCVLAL